MVAPDFDRIRKTLLLRGEPDRVPIMESHVDRDVKGAFLGRPVRDLSDEVEFWMTAGYDFVPMGIGMRTAIRAATGMVQTGVDSTDFSGALKTHKARYSVFEDDERERAWAEDGTGIIAGRAEFESIRWPDPDAMDYSPFESVKDHLPPGAKVIASVGYIFATVSRLMGFSNFCEKLIEDARPRCSCLRQGRPDPASRLRKRGPHGRGGGHMASGRRCLL